MILLTAMVGAIVLTPRRHRDVPRPAIGKQLGRTVKDGLVITQPVSGQGAKPIYWQPKPVDKKIRVENEIE